MTTSERVQAVVDYGFTERQARFLVLVMRHSGLCVKRQYAAFAGIANGGEKCNLFFAKLVRRGLATETACIHNRAHLYHVHAKQLYYACGEPDSRYRRTVPARAADERLMRLDAALISPDLEWLTTRSEKLAYLASRTAGSPVPAAVDTRGEDRANVANQFPGTFPIGIDQAGRTVLLYVATKPWTDEFRAFLIGHTELLSVAGAWTVRVVFPQPIGRSVPAYQAVAREEFETPLDADTIRELQHYFFHRRRGTDLAAIPGKLNAILTRYGQVYGGPRFTQLYRRWLANEGAALTPVSPAIPAALAAGRGVVECVILPHAYEHLSPLVRREGVRRRRHTEAGTKGDESRRSVNPSLNPVP